MTLLVCFPSEEVISCRLRIASLNIDIFCSQSEPSFLPKQASLTKNKPLLQKTSLSYRKQASLTENKPLLQKTSLFYRKQASFTENKPLLQKTSLSNRKQAFFY